MKFQIDRETLLAPLSHLMGVVEKRQTMPILSNVLMRLMDDSLEMTATSTPWRFASIASVICALVAPSSTRKWSPLVPARATWPRAFAPRSKMSARSSGDCERISTRPPRGLTA